jgi:hypothetical protein
MQLRYICRRDRAHTLQSEERRDNKLDGPAVLVLRGWLASNRHVLRQEALAKLLDRCRPSLGVPERSRVSVTATHLTEHACRGAPGVFRCDRPEVPDHNAPRASMPAVLDEKEAFATRHDADAKARQLFVEDNVVLLSGLEALDSSLR